MRSNKGSLVALVLAGILTLAPVAAFGHGGGGGGHGGGGGGFGGGHSGGFAGHSFTGRGFAGHEGAHFAQHENHFQHGDRFRHERDFSFGGSFYNDYPYGYDYPYDGYYEDYAGIVLAVQQELTQLGYYHGPVDGVIAPQTEAAIRWFQSVDKLPVTGEINDRTLNALGIS